MRSILALLALAVFLIACTRTAEPSPSGAGVPGDTVQVETGVPYDFDHPEAAFQLPGRLREISGLTVLPDGQLGAVQDEEGILYVLDAETAEVVAEHRFAGRGDYEGLEAVGESVWVIQSDGDLFEITDPRSDDPQRTKYDTDLHRSCDAEGLAYQPDAERFLIACKENPGAELPNLRAIYAVDHVTRTRSPAPVFRLSRAVLDASGRSFKPSALAVHPRTGQVYVLSSVRKALAVLDPDGALVAALALPDDRYPQPEGLAFAPDGTLYVSNEGRSGAATLYRFREQPLP